MYALILVQILYGNIQQHLTISLLDLLVITFQDSVIMLNQENMKNYNATF